MNCKKLIYNLLYLVSILMVSSALCGCKQDEPDDSPYVTPAKEKESTVLIYAVATNSLAGNLVSDKMQMLSGAAEIDLEANNILLFETRYAYNELNQRYSSVKLLKLSREDGVLTWKDEKEYDPEVAALDPAVVSAVMKEVVDSYPAKTYGAVFWSHSTASQPYLTPEMAVTYGESGDSRQVALPEVGSFGQDKNYNDGDDFYQINVDVLAAALPDNLFDYIWFDSCYMSNIETIFQFRNKCNFFGGYPTEVLEYGLPYDLVLPYMVGENYDLVKVGELFYQYYSNSFGTVAVVDMSEVNDFADFCRPVFSDPVNVSVLGFTKYSRFSTGPFYDLGDYIKATVKEKGLEISDEEIMARIDSMILYKATTSGSYLGLNIDPETYSGVSAHVYAFNDRETDSESYYKSFDWFKSVFQ